LMEAPRRKPGDLRFMKAPGRKPGDLRFMEAPGRKPGDLLAVASSPVLRLGAFTRLACTKPFASKGLRAIQTSRKFASPALSG